MRADDFFAEGFSRKKKIQVYNSQVRMNCGRRYGAVVFLFSNYSETHASTILNS